MSEVAKLEVAKGAILAFLPLVGLLAAWWRARGQRRAGLVALSLLAALALGTYTTWAIKAHRPYLNGYDLFHYYLTAKYYDELGLDRLYLCALVADAELQRPHLDGATQIRDLRTYQRIGRARALKQADTCTGRFSAARWAAFKRDLRGVERLLSKEALLDAVVDRGANASPLWMLMGGAVARVTPVAYLPWACQLDTALMGGAVVLVAWAFGAEVGLIFLIFVTTSYCTRDPAYGASLFRYDWLATLVASVCFWRRDRPATAGIALGLATGSRIFPFLLFGGVVARGLWRTLRARRLPVAETRLAVGFVASLAVLCALAVADHGVASFAVFWEKLAVHSAVEHISKMRVGLPVAAAWRGDLPGSEAMAAYALHNSVEIAVHQHPWVQALGLAALLAVLLVARRPRLSDDHALLLGAALVPLMLQISYPYYAFLAVPLLLYAGKLPTWAAALGVGAICWPNALADLADGHRVPHYTILAPGSVWICLCAVAVIAAAALSKDGEEPAPAA